MQLTKYHPIKTWGSGSSPPRILHFGTRRRWVVSFTLRPRWQREKPLVPAGTRTSVVQPVAKSLYWLNYPRLLLSCTSYYKIEWEDDCEWWSRKNAEVAVVCFEVLYPNLSGRIEGTTKNFRTAATSRSKIQPWTSRIRMKVWTAAVGNSTALWTLSFHSYITATASWRVGNLSCHCVILFSY
jgi:hypothetical protein